MSLYLSSINSGSNGNCYYIGNEQDAVLIDAGISCRETFWRMSRMGLPIHKVKAIFISHEHTDHTRGVEVLSRKYNLPVYLTAATHGHSYLHISPWLLKYFMTGDCIQVGSLTVEAFAKRHDAADPQSFVISHDGISIGVMTDIGSACENLKHHFGRCHAAFLEANYDEQMLDEGVYPYYLKKRIRSDEGHLSNHQALELFLNHRPHFMTHLLLSHLSQQNNRPDLALEVFRPHAGNIHIDVASRHEPSKVYCIQ
jgi:phosphoribosyl 1,2-cyclic phosphodiesterase